MPDEFNYPTPEEIMAYPVHVDEDCVQVLRDWHQVYKRVEFPKRVNLNMWQHQRYVCLASLIGRLSKLFDVKVRMVLIGGLSRNGMAFRNEKVIVLGSTSIITCLHEFGHLLISDDEHADETRRELAATAWAVKMFQTAFPEFYERLEFKGHMLVKKRRQPAPVTEDRPDDSGGGFMTPPAGLN